MTARTVRAADGRYGWYCDACRRPSGMTYDTKAKAHSKATYHDRLQGRVTPRAAPSERQ